jgi:predicted oxidoreductase
MSSRLIHGCMALGGDWDAHTPLLETHIAQAHAAVEAALAIGIRVFDHADIYRHGKAELAFGELLRRRPSLRGEIHVQSKCGIRFGDAQAPGRYDLSAAHIEASVDAILQRLHIERLDTLLLHRPDPLMQPDEIAAALARLKAAGKVGRLGVSNMHAGHMAWLQTAVALSVNQLEISLAKPAAIEAGTTFNHPQATPHSVAWAGTLEHCQRHGIEVQAWGALAQGRFADHPQVSEIAARHASTPSAVVLAWLMRHPAGIRPVIGSANPARIAACADAETLALSRDEWYSLYVGARGQALP